MMRKNAGKFLFSKLNNNYKKQSINNHDQNFLSQKKKYYLGGVLSLNIDQFNYLNIHQETNDDVFVCIALTFFTLI